MPLYEYKCDHCGEITEMFRSMDHRHDSSYCNKCEGKLFLHFTVPRALRTDTEFQKGIHFHDGLRSDKERTQAKAIADRMGVHIEGKRYDGRLARFPLDPLAFYGNRQEARAAAIRTKQSSPDLGVPPPVDETTGKPYEVAEDIVEKHAKEKVIDEHGGTVSREKWNKIKEETREAISPHF